MGRELLASLGASDRPLHLLMDSAYAGNETIQLALDFGYIPVVPPPRTRVEPWEYDREMYKRRNEVERLFRRLKGYRRIFSRFEKLDIMFLGFICFALVADGALVVLTIPGSAAVVRQPRCCAPQAFGG